MQNINNTMQDLYDNLSPDLLTKISQNANLNTLILTGDTYLGFFTDNNELFADAIIGTFQKNNSIKTIVFEKLSSESIRFLLPALSKIEKLILRNLAPDEILFICNTLSDSLPMAPEIILDQQMDDTLCQNAVSHFNQKRMGFLHSITSQKRDFKESKLKDNNPPKKRRRQEAKEEITEEKDMEIEPINPQVMQLAILQNPQLFCNFIQHIHLENLIPQNTTHPVITPEIIELRGKHKESFAKMAQAYLECAPLLPIEREIEKKGNKATQNIRNEFCAFAAKAHGDELKPFIPMLRKKANSPVFALRTQAILLAAEQGNRNTLNQLLGGRFRMVSGEPTAENIEAVLNEREILVIKRDSNIALKTANLAFKNKNGLYEEAPTGRLKIQDFLFESQALCKDVTAITRFIKLLDSLNAAPIFLRRKWIVPASVLENAFIAALQNGHLPVLYDLLDYLNIQNKIIDFKPSVTDENCFSNVVNYLASLASKNGYTKLLNLIVHEPQGKTVNVHQTFENAILNNKPEILDELLRTYFFSDSEIQSYFQLAAHYGTIEIAQYLLDNYFHSIGITEPQPYEINIIKDLKDLTVTIENYTSSSVYIFIEDGYSLGIVSSGEFKEYKITNPSDLAFIKKILSDNAEATVFNTSGWSTRHCRLLLLSLGAPVDFQYDPQILAQLMDVRTLNTYHLGNTLTSNFDPIHLFINNKNYDLSLNDNQLLKCLASRSLILTGNPDSHVEDALCYNIVQLFTDIRVNPPCPANGMDYCAQGIKRCIEKGYDTVLPILINHHPEWKNPITRSRLKLSQLFLDFPELMKQAIDTAVQNDHQQIITILMNSLEFASPSEDVIKKWNERKQTNLRLHAQLNNLTKPNNHYKQEYIQSEKIRLKKEIKDNRLLAIPLAKMVDECSKTNNKILGSLLSSSLLYKSKPSAEWQQYLNSCSRKAPVSSALFDYALGWPKIKVWKEMKYQHGFFPINDPSKKIDLPDKIFDLIEHHFLNIHLRPSK